MLKLTRYIALTVSATTLLTLFALAALFFILTFLGQAGDIQTHGYTAGVALENVLLNLPANLYIILPMAGLLGSLMGLGLLASSSELTAMRAAGLSITKIAIGVLIASILFILLNFFIGSYLAPKLQHYAMMRKLQAIQQQSFLVTPGSSWFRLGGDFIHIAEAKSQTELSDVTRYHIEDHRLKSVIQAKEAVYKDGSWHLHDIVTTMISTKKIKQIHAKIASWKQLVSPEILAIALTKNDYLTLAGLHTYIDYRVNNHLDASNYQLQFWQILFNPLSVLILMLLALPFVFGPLRSSNKSLRLLAGILTGFMFFLINQFFGSFSLVYKMPPIFGALIPSLIFLVILMFAIWLMER